VAPVTGIWFAGDAVAAGTTGSVGAGVTVSAGVFPPQAESSNTVSKERMYSFLNI
jgi:pantoate kinase